MKQDVALISAAANSRTLTTHLCTRSICLHAQQRTSTSGRRTWCACIRCLACDAAAAALQMRLAEVAVRLDYKRDESYTPSMLSIRAGTSDLDLKEIRAVQMHEPVGWLVVTLQPPGMT